MKRMYYIGYMLCLLLAGCVVGEKADGLLEQRLSDRTLLVYMGGDNDLADETDEKLSADRKSTRLNSSHSRLSRMPSSA